MRFLSLFAKLLVGILLLAVLTATVGREAWLFWGSWRLAEDVRQIVSPQKWQNQVYQCGSGLEISGPLYSGIQLRFLNDHEYVLEVNCTSRVPVTLVKRSLPWMVRKTTGSPGFSYDATNGALSGELTLNLFNQNRVIFADGLKVSQEWGETDIRSALPPSVCEAHGLRCCDAQNQIGVGTGQFDGVTDCPGRCFDSCLQRPTLLSFQSDPSPSSTESRTVEIFGSSSLVFFGYAFDSQQAEIQEVVIDFGDGTSEVMTESQGRVEKEFTCFQTQCIYPVTIQAKDTRGIVSPETRLSELTILMNQ